MEVPNIFFITLGISIVIFPLFLLFFHLTGDKYLMKDFTYNEDICFPSKNAWIVQNCILTDPKITDETEPRKCFYNRDCHISFNEPKTAPIWFWFMTIIAIFTLIWTGPTPSDPHWKKKSE